ncbi:predicted protein [Brucella sp. 83/13]|nr:predicted protein [Brucella sp. 83/13]
MLVSLVERSMLALRVLSAVIGFPHENTGGVLEHFAVWWNHLTEHKCGESWNQERFVRLAKCFCRCGLSHWAIAMGHLQFAICNSTAPT